MPNRSRQIWFCNFLINYFINYFIKKEEIFFGGEEEEREERGGFSRLAAPWEEGRGVCL